MEEPPHKVLIVDDVEMIADTLEIIFSTNGYQARGVHSAEEAVKILTAWPADLALIDVVLPEMNGVELAILLRDQHPSCRILLFSGQSITDDLIAAAGDRGFKFELLVKPVHPMVVLEAIKKLLIEAPGVGQSNSR